MKKVPALLNRGAIFCFHAVDAPEARSSSVSSISLAAVEPLLDTLCDAATVVPLRTLIERVEAGRSCRGLAALTFDDAYVTVDSHVVPAAAARAMPITLFAVSAASADGSRFWWDRIDDLHPLVEPTRWRRFEHEAGLPDAYRVGQPAQFGPLRPLRQWILAEGKGRLLPRVAEALTALECDAGQTTQQLPLRYARLAQLAQTGLVEIAVHTVSHPVLPLLDDAELHREVAEAHRQVRERVPSALAVLAIPYGLFDPRTLRIARQAGMRMALTLTPRAVPAHAPDGALPRFTIGRRTSPASLLAALWGIRQLREVLRRPPSYPQLPSPTT